MPLQITFSLLMLLQPLAWDFHLKDDHEIVHSKAEWQHKQAVILFFISTECPISNRYAPTINRMVQEYAAKNVAFYLVQSDPDLTAQAAEEHAKEFALSMPVLMDPTQVLASKMDVSVTPTAVIVNSAGEIKYRGRVDDRNIDLGTYRDNPKREDLKIALEEVLAGKPVSQPQTKVIGCYLPPPSKKDGKEPPRRALRVSPPNLGGEFCRFPNVA
jgi:peroxiredoxin